MIIFVIIFILLNNIIIVIPYIYWYNALLMGTLCQITVILELLGLCISSVYTFTYIIYPSRIINWNVEISFGETICTSVNYSFMEYKVGLQTSNSSVFHSYHDIFSMFYYKIMVLILFTNFFLLRYIYLNMFLFQLHEFMAWESLYPKNYQGLFHQVACVKQPEGISH